MNWAWQLRVKSTMKFVLIALADARDDVGVRVAQAREHRQEPVAINRRDPPVRAPPCPADPGERLVRIRQALAPKTDVNA